MLVGVEKTRCTVAILYWGNGKTKNGVRTEIFSQGHEKPLDRGAKNPLTYSARGAKIQLQISHSTDLGN